MRRSTRILVGVGATLIGIPTAFVLGVTVWVTLGLPDNMDPPEVLLPQVALQVFWVELGGPADNEPELPSSLRLLGQLPQSKQDQASRSLAYQAARIVMNRQSPRLRQLRYTLTSILASAIISKTWSAPEALTEFADGSYYGHGYTGISQAAVGFFGHSVSDLSPKELTMLAAITHSPSSYSPWCSPDRLEKRMNHLAMALGISTGIPLVLAAPPGACVEPGTT